MYLASSMRTYHMTCFLLFFFSDWYYYYVNQFSFIRYFILFVECLQSCKLCKCIEKEFENFIYVDFFHSRIIHFRNLFFKVGQEDLKHTLLNQGNKGFCSLHKSASVEGYTGLLLEALDKGMC